MGSKDLSLKKLESYPDVFADIINVLMYDGKVTLDKSLLKVAKTNNEFWRKEKMREVVRDVAMTYENKSYRMALYGIENQSGTDRFMPIRVMTYDALGYIYQLIDLKEIAKKDKQKGKGAKEASDEEQQKKWKIYPVRTIVLYFGDGEWNTSVSLKDCVEEFEGSNYKIDVVSVAKLSQETLNKFTSDFRHIARYVAQGKNIDNYKFPFEDCEHFDAVCDFLRAYEGDSKFILEYNEQSRMEKGGNVNVKDLFQIRFDGAREEGIVVGLEKGREEGLVAGREEGREEGLVEAALRLLEMGKFSFEDIAKGCGLSLERVKELAEGVLQVNGK